MGLLEDGINHAKSLFFEDSPNRKEELSVLRKYGEIFNSKIIENITWDQLYSFTLWRNNRHWTNLHRMNSKLESNFDRVREALKILLDERISITERLKLTIPPDAQYKAEGTGPALFTAILTVAYPDKYAVFNNTVITAVNVLQELDEIDTRLGTIRKYNFVEQYVEFNKFVSDLAKKNNLTLWQMDWVWFYILDNLPDEEDVQTSLMTEDFPEGDEDDEEPSVSLASYLPNNIILYGPVGTGKTTYAKMLARGIAGGSIRSLEDLTDLINSDNQRYKEDIETDHQIEVVTFHKSYGYEQFVEGIRPVKNKDGSLSYDYKSGVFKSFSDNALKSLKEGRRTNYVLIIDEINRGDISRIFGELITLIESDKRYYNEEKSGMMITLPYTGEQLIVPRNLYVIGTMNTTDKSIAMIDLALRRRFYFIEVPPDKEKLKSAIAGRFENDLLNQAILLLFDKLNFAIENSKGTDFGIGQAYFLNVRNEEDLLNTWMYRIMPLLQEYYYDEEQKLLDILGNVIKISNGNIGQSRSLKDYKTFDSPGAFLNSILGEDDTENNGH